jgi:hypothetical protein
VPAEPEMILAAFSVVVDVDVDVDVDVVDVVLLVAIEPKEERASGTTKAALPLTQKVKTASDILMVNVNDVKEGGWE